MLGILYWALQVAISSANKKKHKTTTNSAEKKSTANSAEKLKLVCKSLTANCY